MQPSSTDPVPYRTRVGRAGEDLAVGIMADAGITVLERNWRCRAGEIDIIGREQRGDGSVVLVFCEVKTRVGYAFGDPLEAITATKQRHMRLAARAYLHQLGHADSDGCAGSPGPRWARFDEVRFDAIGIVYGTGRTPRVQYLQDVA